jgi:hypothetical protein
MNGGTRWERLGAATGIAFVVFLLASFVVIPDTPPALDDPISETRSFYTDNSSAWQASVYLTGIAAFFFIWFLGSLRSALERAEARLEGGVRVARIVTPAGAVTLALALVNAAISDALATRVAAEADQAVIRALYDVLSFTVTFTAFPLAALVAATSVVSYRTDLLPPLVTWLGFSLVPAWFVAGFGMFVESGTFSPTGAVGFVVLLVWVAWILAVSASLIRRAGTPALTDTT